MNSLFYRHRKASPATRPLLPRLAIWTAFVIIGANPIASRLVAQSGDDAASEFKRISQELSVTRLGGGAESGPQMEIALAYLDSIALSALSSSANPNLDEVNRGLMGLVSRMPPVGENYRLVRLGGTPGVYAMVINFGQGGPAAVRIYGGSPGHYALAAKIDRFVQKDFFDSDIELVPVSKTEPLFVTISGRTDDLSTGLFAAWRFDGNQLISLWTSDLLQESSYEADDGGFHLAYCSRVDEDRPSQCLKMSRDLYRFQDGEWKRIETTNLPEAKPTAK
jgi:hypothetical protein